MTNPSDRDTWIHPDLDKNRRAFPQHELMKYVNRHIAWNWEGTQILADGDTLDEVADKLERRGINLSRVVFDYVPDATASQIGGIL